MFLSRTALTAKAQIQLAQVLIIWYDSHVKRVLRIFKFIAEICLGCILSMLFFGCNRSSVSDADFQLTVFSCGKADCILVQHDGKAVLIDTGENGDGQQILDELAARNISRIDLMILTHHDKDHIGGADIILDSMPVTAVRLPSYISDSTQYKQLAESLSRSGAEVVLMTEDDSFALGSADYIIWTSTISYDGKNDNEQSLVVKILYHGKAFLLMGDAEKAWLKELCLSGRNLTCDVLKLPHHGVYDKNLITLLPLSLPDYVLITDSAKNPADKKTVDLLNTFEMKCFYTKDGSIYLSMNNNVIKIKQ